MTGDGRRRTGINLGPRLLPDRGADLRPDGHRQDHPGPGPGPGPGLPVIESDRVRKTLAGLTPTTRAAEAFGQGIYAADFSSRTYEEMRRQAAAHLAAGESVILDGSYKRAGERDWCGNWPGSTGPQWFSFTASAPRRRPGGAWGSGSRTPRPSPTAGWSCSRPRPRISTPWGRRTGPCCAWIPTGKSAVVLEELQKLRAKLFIRRPLAAVGAASAAASMELGQLN